jgi:hypothetical protein
VVTIDAARDNDFGPADGYPPPLLDDYLAIAQRESTRAVARTATRMRSLSARRLLAHDATNGSGSLEQLLAGARGEPGARGALERDGVRPAAVANLARVMVWQASLPDDFSDALSLYELALENARPGSIPEGHQGLHPTLAFHSGDHDRAEALLDLYPNVPETTRALLELDLVNPYLRSSDANKAVWLSRLEDLIAPAHLAFSDDDARAPFDRLGAKTDRRVEDGPLVSVIVTTYRPGDELETAVRSLINQSWANLEILIVDDGSGPEYRSVLHRCEELDPRIELLELDANIGTYRARNVALDAASGEFITYLDSDDWAHPVRLENQVSPLLAEPSPLATIGKAIKATDDLRLTELGSSGLVDYIPSFLFRRDPVFTRLGYLDRTRKAADNEYVRRLKATFGPDTIHRVSAVVGLYRAGPGSLSGADFRGPWLHPARFAYKSAYSLWHRRIASGEADPHLPSDPSTRLFAAPAYVTDRDGGPDQAEACDVVLAGDWRRGVSQRAVVEKINALRRRGLRVGLMPIEAMRLMTLRRQMLPDPIQELINAGAVAHCLSTERRRVSLLIIEDPLCLQFGPGQSTRLEIDRVAITANREPCDADGQELRYLPSACMAAAERLFSVRALWLPLAPQIREALEAGGVSGPELSELEIRPVIDPDAWGVERSELRSERPALGFHHEGERSEWPEPREQVLGVYPDAPEIDVRIMGDTESTEAALGSSQLPQNWTRYEAGELSAARFLSECDFWAYFPQRSRGEAYSQAVLEALASGCVVILPAWLRDTYGDAAIYRSPGEVGETIRDYHSNPEQFLEQSRLARERTRELFGPKRYSDLVSILLASRSKPAASSGGEGSSVIRFLRRHLKQTAADSQSVGQTAERE